jgi:hypothetical protein
MGVDKSMSVERWRKRAAEEVETLLGIDADTEALFHLAAETFDAQRADRCKELAGWARLTRRSMACSSVATRVTSNSGSM